MRWRQGICAATDRPGWPDSLAAIQSTITALGVQALDIPEGASLALVNILMIGHTLGRGIIVATSRAPDAAGTPASRTEHLADDAHSQLCGS